MCVCVRVCVRACVRVFVCVCVVLYHTVLTWVCMCVKCFRRQSSKQSPVNHCRIRTKQENGQTMYYLIEPKLFDSLYNLITYYRTHPLRSQNFSQILSEPIPQPDEHKTKPYAITGSLHVRFYATQCLSASVTSQYCIECTGWIKLVLGVEAFFDLLLRFKEICVPSNARVLFSGTLSQTLDLENFATTHRSL